MFRICKRYGKVYTEVVDHCSKGTILAAIRGKVDLRLVVHSDGFNSYDGLVDMGYKRNLQWIISRTNQAAGVSAATISTASSASGATQSPSWLASAACTRTRSTSTSRSVTSASTTAARTRTMRP